MTNRVSKRIVVALISLWLVGCTTAGGTRPTTYIAPDPKAADINVQLGLSYMQRGNYEIALEKLEKALQQNPNLPSAHNAIALLFQRLGESDKAEKHFKESVLRDPRYSEAQNNYGVFLCEQKHYEAAVQRFLEATKNPLYESKAQALENAGTCANRIPDQTLAEHYFLQALQLNPHLSKSLLQMAKLRFLNVEYEQALSYIQRYQQVANWVPSALYTAIQIGNKLNDQDAVSSYALLLRGKFPDSDEAQLVKRGEY